MDKNIGPVIVIIITVLAAFSNFLLYDHSGVVITDVSLEEINDTNSFNLSYYLRIGRNFNSLKYEYYIYSIDGKLIYNNSSTTENIYSGSHNYQDIIKLNKPEIPAIIEFKVYNKINSSNDSLNMIYDKKINLTI